MWTCPKCGRELAKERIAWSMPVYKKDKLSISMMITLVLIAIMIAYKHISRKKMSPIMLIVLSAITGIIAYSM